MYKSRVFTSFYILFFLVPLLFGGLSELIAQGTRLNVVLIMADDLGSGRKMFVAGDIRANENLLLISFHTVFMREHNRTCDDLIANNPKIFLI